MSNRLKDESSPYLLQHADNPVDWYPWCEEAFETAEREDKPLFLSVGYSTCHWCHVMAHESFEDSEIAEILNQYFVSIKVDREERPDIDSVYMSVCQALTGSGGWPMSIFMTAQQKPFFAGTYFPPVAHYGMPGFRELLLGIAEKWKNNKEEVLQSADEILAYIKTGAETEPEDGTGNMPGNRIENLSKNGMDKKQGSMEQQMGSDLPGQAAEIFSKSFDVRYGGFGDAPKFPTPHNLIFLTLYARLMGDEAALTQVRVTLDKMRRGGIFDHIGHGFSRYSTDRYYLVPHFEKMLYDNALLILAYAIFYKASGDSSFLDTAEKTAEYVLRELKGAEGGFYSAQDADSEGEEGKYYVWSYEEICGILGKERGRRFCDHYGITRKGNFEGKNIPNLLNGNAISGDFEEERRMLYDYRRSRARLHLDDKILTSWNSLMICALAVLYRVTGNGRYLLAAEEASRFIEEHLTEGELLLVSCRDGVRSVKGFLDEYAYDTAALLGLYEVTEAPVYLERAKRICGEAVRQFADEKGGGFFLYGTENDRLIARPKETYDGALPSGNSVMAYCLVRLSQLVEKEYHIPQKDGEASDAGESRPTERMDYKQAAERQLSFLSAEAVRYPAGHSMFLIALLFYFYPPEKITVVLAEAKERERVMLRLPLYAELKILEHATEKYGLLHGKTTYYVCRNYTCFPPTNQEPVLQ